ncbi:hypothetical protein ACOMHN_057908 [Nucella lapillus]
MTDVIGHHASSTHKHNTVPFKTEPADTVPFKTEPAHTEPFKKKTCRIVHDCQRLASDQLLLVEDGSADYKDRHSAFGDSVSWTALAAQSVRSAREF